MFELQTRDRFVTTVLYILGFYIFESLTNSRSVCTVLQILTFGNVRLVVASCAPRGPSADTDE